MRFNQKKVFIVLLIFVALIGDVNAPFESYTCILVDGNQCDSGAEPTVMCNTDPGGNCPVICAAACGSMTGCITEDCENCCLATTCNVGRYNPATQKEESIACRDACEGTCEVNNQFCSIILILQSIAVGLATLMLVVNGFKWMVADDAQGRMDAKRGVYYVFIGLAVVIIAFALVNYLYIGEVTCPF